MAEKNLKLRIQVNEDCLTFLKEHPEMTLHGINCEKKVASFYDASVAQVKPAINYFDGIDVEITNLPKPTTKAEVS